MVIISPLPSHQHVPTANCGYGASGPYANPNPALSGLRAHHAAHAAAFGCTVVAWPSTWTSKLPSQSWSGNRRRKAAVVPLGVETKVEGGGGGVLM